MEQTTEDSIKKATYKTWNMKRGMGMEQNAIAV